MERLLVMMATMVLAIVPLGCSSGSGGVSAVASRPAAISHVVFFKLHDPGDAGALIADCDRLLPGIPGVVCYAAGRHLETGRGAVESGYDVGLYIGFDDAGAYSGYVDDPRHVALVRGWRERLEWYRVYDVLDPTP